MSAIVNIVTAEEMRRLEAVAREDFGLSEATLMESAGTAVADVILDRLESRHKTVVIVCGTGNNGGDGFVCARVLKNAGVSVKVLLFGDPDRIGGAARAYFGGVDIMRIPIVLIQKAIEAAPYIAEADVVVDALIGTGLTGEVTGEKAELIEIMNRNHAMMVSVDMPSGVMADTGKTKGAVIFADVTVALGALKRAHVLACAKEFCGEVVLSDIGIPAAADLSLHVFEVNRQRMWYVLPLRDWMSHKGKNGFIGIIAGSADMAGAGLLAAQGALCAGAGKVELLTTKAVARSLAGRIPEVMVRGVADGDAFSAADAETVLAAAAAYDVVVIGPGLSRAEETQIFVEKILQKLAKPIVADADALYAMATRKTDLASLPGEYVLTPHVGEFSRLSGLSAKETEEERIDAAVSLAKKTGTTVVLKGAPTVTADRFGSAYVNTTGNPGMATGGMGDTLSGVIAALIGQDAGVVNAAYGGVYLHGLAGDLLAKETPVGFTAGELAKKIPEAWALIEKE